MKPVTLLVSLVFLASPLAADSDGTYCAGTDYLVFDRIVAGVNGQDRLLEIVRFGPDEELGSRGSVSLGPHQVHGLVCGDDEVEIAFWHGLAVFAPTDRNGELSEVELYDEEGAIPDRFGDQTHLGRLANVALRYWTEADEDLPLRSTDPEARYALAISVRESERCRYRVRSVLRRTERRPGGRVRELELWNEEFDGECAGR